MNFNPALDFDVNDQMRRSDGFFSTDYYVVFDPDSVITSGTSNSKIPLGWDSPFATVVNDQS